jgi:hypothetical protein
LKRVAACVVVVVLALCAGLMASVLCTSKGTRVTGHLAASDLAAIKRAVRDDLFKTSAPKWLPDPMKTNIWIPIERPFFDARHPIDFVVVRASNQVEVYFRGPEMKAYVNGIEHGWFTRSVRKQKASRGWVGPPPAANPAITPGVQRPGMWGGVPEADRLTIPRGP